jgi:hypothetical protein
VKATSGVENSSNGAESLAAARLEEEDVEFCCHRLKSFRNQSEAGKACGNVC